MLRTRVLLAGDAAVGKTALAKMFASGSTDYPRNYVMVRGFIPQRVDAASERLLVCIVNSGSSADFVPLPLQTTGIELSSRSIKAPSLDGAAEEAAAGSSIRTATHVEFQIIDTPGSTIFNQREAGMKIVRRSVQHSRRDAACGSASFLSIDTPQRQRTPCAPTSLLLLSLCLPAVGPGQLSCGRVRHWIQGQLRFRDQVGAKGTRCTRSQRIASTCRRVLATSFVPARQVVISIHGLLADLSSLLPGRPPSSSLLLRAGKAIAGVLIGAKADFRDDSAGLARAEVAKEDAAALAASLGLAYFEVSSVRVAAQGWFACEPICEASLLCPPLPLPLPLAPTACRRRARAWTRPSSTWRAWSARATRRKWRTRRSWPRGSTRPHEALRHTYYNCIACLLRCACG